MLLNFVYKVAGELCIKSQLYKKQTLILIYPQLNIALITTHFSRYLFLISNYLC
jgi:hypothetical protein